MYLSFSVRFTSETGNTEFYTQQKQLFRVSPGCRAVQSCVGSSCCWKWLYHILFYGWVIFQCVSVYVCDIFTHLFISGARYSLYSHSADGEIKAKGCSNSLTVAQLVRGRVRARIQAPDVSWWVLFSVLYSQFLFSWKCIRRIPSLGKQENPDLYPSLPWTVWHFLSESWISHFYNGDNDGLLFLFCVCQH